MPARDESEWLIAAAIAAGLFYLWKRAATPEPESHTVPMPFPDLDTGYLTHANQVPAVKTTAEIADAAGTFASAWANIFKDIPTKETLALLMAHSALETDEWRQMYNWNPGYLTTVHGEWFKGPKSNAKYHFASYPSLYAGAIAWISSIRGKFARALPALLAGNAEQYGSDLAASGYYELLTDHTMTDYIGGLKRYQAKFLPLIQSVNT